MTHIIKHLIDYFNSNIEIVINPTKKQLKLVENGEKIYYLTDKLNNNIPKNILDEYEDLFNSYMMDKVSYKKVSEYYNNIDPTYKEKTLSNYFDSDLYNTIFKQLTVLDAYGSGKYQLGKDKFYLFNNYGDSDLDRNPLRFHTFILLDSSNKLHCVDISYNIEKDLFYAENYKSAMFPDEFLKYPIKEYCGKRSYYYYPTKKEIAFRCSDKAYKNINPKYHKPSDDVSGNRVVITLTVDKL